MSTEHELITEELALHIDALQLALMKCVLQKVCMFSGPKSRLNRHPVSQS